MGRVFEITQAVRKDVPLLVGMFGPTASGKTFSALRIATGIQRARGGDIVLIDTESRRALHYADAPFKFKHLVLDAPFSPSDYLAACMAAKAKGAGVIVIDSASHMHEGVGGLLEQHDAIVEKMSGGDWKKAAAVSMAAWVKPKQEFQRFKDAVLRLGVPLVFCFRGKQKIKAAPKGSQDKTPIEQGWMPIISDELTFEMTVNALLEPGCDGVPSWKPEQAESRARVKLPGQFREYFMSKRGPLDENDGEMLARWADGETSAPGTSSSGAKPPVNAKLPPVFRPRVEWDGNGNWSERPFNEAPLDVLDAYFNAVDVLSKDARMRDHVREQLREHLSDIATAIADLEPPEQQAAI